MCVCVRAHTIYKLYTLYIHVYSIISINSYNVNAYHFISCMIYIYIL